MCNLGIVDSKACGIKALGAPVGANRNRSSPLVSIHRQRTIEENLRCITEFELRVQRTLTFIAG